MLETYLKYRDPVERAKRAHARKTAVKREATEKTESVATATKGEIVKTMSAADDSTETPTADKTKVADSMVCKDFDHSRERSSGSAASSHAIIPTRAPDPNHERVPGRKPISARERHAVNLRDQRRCQQTMPDGVICGQTRWVQLHHIVAVSEGGSDAAENLNTLCSHHHRRRHPEIRF